MLSGMTSLTLPAHATAAPAFNALFYATMATVIPVLFLALAVQGRMYEDMVRAYSAAARRLTPLHLHASFRQLTQHLTAVFVRYVLALAMSGILVFGTLGEVFAADALYRQQAVAGPFVLFGVIFMAIVTAAGPALAYLRLLPDDFRQLRDFRRAGSRQAGSSICDNPDARSPARQHHAAEGQDAPSPESPQPRPCIPDPPIAKAGKQADTEG
jgi:hypothetical protein